MSWVLWMQSTSRNPKIKPKQKHSFRAELYPEVCVFFQLYQLHLSGILPLQKLHTTALTTTAALPSTKGIFPAKYLKSKYWCYDLHSNISNQCFHWRQGNSTGSKWKQLKNMNFRNGEGQAVHLKGGCRNINFLFWSECLEQEPLQPLPSRVCHDTDRRAPCWTHSKMAFFCPAPWFISQDDSWFVHTQVGMGVCQELQKQKHTSHCYYLLLDNFNISIASEASREALKIATRTLILRHSNSMFHDISICRKKMPLLQVSVYSNINNVISPDV